MFLLLLLCTCALSITDRPVIGIVSLPTTRVTSHLGASSIAASYVKYAEAGGARVVPIPFDSSPAKLSALLDRLNGVLLTGGGDVAADSPYFRTVGLIIQHSLASHAAQAVFPVWGTCLGMESMVSYLAETPDVLDRFDAKNISLPVWFIAADSALFPVERPGATRARTLMHTGNITLNSHHWGVTPERFHSDARLHKYLRPIALSRDRQGKVFVAIMEGIRAPIFATQFHPEKSIFEWLADEDIDHSPQARDAMRYLGDFFIDQARLSSNAFASEEEFLALSIYNYVPVFTGRHQTSAFEQTYFFV